MHAQFLGDFSHTYQISLATFPNIRHKFTLDLDTLDTVVIGLHHFIFIKKENGKHPSGNCFNL